MLLTINKRKITNCAGTSFKKIGLMFPGMLPRGICHLVNDDENIDVPHMRFSAVVQHLYQSNPKEIRVHVGATFYICSTSCCS